ncbi:hypothetical protein RJ639_027999 [Escallonia herrerae]|uniref:Cytochrome b561 domain-containing protein n=1 Tax=Escallonia herrerae TaxID=1293975 RepID=A0AA89BEI4_9ASTE|nr:hypothetical protein RJ639_027999 [Escallonia herrerae]
MGTPTNFESTIEVAREDFGAGINILGEPKSFPIESGSMAKGRSSFPFSALPVTIFAHLLVIAIATLLLVWLLHFQDGFAFKSKINKGKIFNLHPLFMVIGFVLVAGEGKVVECNIDN